MRRTQRAQRCADRRSGLFYQDAADVSAYQEAVRQVRDVALSPGESVRLIAREVDQIEETR